MQGYIDAKKTFLEELSTQEWYKIFERVTKIVNYLWKNFLELNWGQLAEAQMQLAWYKYYLAEYVWELWRLAEFYSIEIKQNKASKWWEVSEKIKAEKGKVSNKEQIENELILMTKELSDRKVLNETFYYQYKLKLSALDDVLTAITQRLASLKREM